MTERSIFMEALEFADPRQREAHVLSACGGDERLRARVEALLRRHQSDDVLALDRMPDVDLSVTADPPPADEHAGTTIGPYKLLEQIGEGGMGVVYMAEQTQPIRRKVALKIIKPGMDTKQVIARFEAERQALALMDHPNIARVLDAGATASGRPYFVMELVRGTPITDYCDRDKLSISQRLELFVLICQAVQHAHQKGIIHRDLKPSNVLITLHDGVPVPKVIDFGIAKATGQQLTDKTLFTGFAQFVGTPLYMSPEQAEMSGLDIDTRSDIYSLGVLLYELLTGTTPFDRETFRNAAFDEIRRIIREQEPPQPSMRLSTLGAILTAVSGSRGSDPRKLTHFVRGELDWIVMRALEKDRTRRYETACGLARDIERHLHDEPVEACPPSATYRLVKLARKHRAAMVVLAGFAAVILIAAIVSTLLAIRATTAERLASRRLTDSEEARQQAEVVSRHLVSIFRRPDPNQDGRQVKVVDLLDQAARELDAEFAGASKIKGELLRALGETYSGLGLLSMAVEQLEKALAVQQAALGPNHPDTLKTVYEVAVAYQEADRFDDAMPRFEEALKLYRAKLGPDHPDTLESMYGLAWSYMHAGRLDEAISLNKEVLKRRQELLGPDHPGTLHAMNGLGWSYQVAGRLDEAIPRFGEALKLYQAKLGPNRRETLESMCGLAWSYWDAGRLDEAIRLSEEVLNIAEVKLGPDHPDTVFVKDIHAGALGLKLLQQKRCAEAEPLLRRGLSIYMRKVPWHWSASNGQSLLGESLLGQEKYAEAEPLLIGGYEGMKRREAKIPALLKGRLTEAAARLVQLYEAWGKPEKAAEWQAELQPTAGAGRPKP
jgi:serine/threonine protein kinase/tetratricopeptide (TPR) repeat protein